MQTLITDTAPSFSGVQTLITDTTPSFSGVQTVITDTAPSFSGLQTLITDTAPPEVACRLSLQIQHLQKWISDGKIVCENKQDELRNVLTLIEMIHGNLVSFGRPKLRREVRVGCEWYETDCTAGWDVGL